MIEYEHAVCVYPFTMMLPNGRSRNIQEGTIAVYKDGKWFVGPTNVDTYIKSYFKPLNNWN